MIMDDVEVNDVYGAGETNKKDDLSMARALVAPRMGVPTMKMIGVFGVQRVDQFHGTIDNVGEGRWRWSTVNEPETAKRKHVLQAKGRRNARRWRLLRKWRPEIAGERQP